MTELELIRTPGDRRRYALEDIGTIHLEGLFARSANAEAGSDHWQFVRSGFWQRVMQATDATGNVVGEFRPRDLRRGGKLEWAGRELRLRPASSWRERYALADGDDELVILDGKSWGRRPVSVSIPDGQPVEPGLLLFACFVVRQLAVNAANDSAAGSSRSSCGRRARPSPPPHWRRRCSSSLRSARRSWRSPTARAGRRASARTTSWCASPTRRCSRSPT
jgi:hypothetical protein